MCKALYIYTLGVGAEDVINMSLGGYSRSEAEADAVNERMAQAAAEMMHA